MDKGYGIVRRQANCFLKSRDCLWSFPTLLECKPQKMMCLRGLRSQTERFLPVRYRLDHFPFRIEDLPTLEMFLGSLW